MIIATAAIMTTSEGIPVSSISAKSKLPIVRPIDKNPRSKITAPTCVQKKNISAILRLGPSPYQAIKKKEGISITSKKM